MTAKKLRKVGSVMLYEWSCACARCGHKWKSTGPAAPIRCASCKAPGYDKKPRPYRRRPRRRATKP